MTSVNGVNGVNRKNNNLYIRENIYKIGIYICFYRVYINKKPFTLITQFTNKKKAYKINVFS